VLAQVVPDMGAVGVHNSLNVIVELAVHHFAAPSVCKGSMPATRQAIARSITRNRGQRNRARSSALLRPDGRTISARFLSGEINRLKINRKPCSVDMKRPAPCWHLPFGDQKIIEGNRLFRSDICSGRTAPSWMARVAPSESTDHRNRWR
jgi:hypothetical protein